MTVTALPTCLFCGNAIVDKQASARYCDDYCRGADWRARNAAQWRLTQPYPITQVDLSNAANAKPCGCEQPIPELDDPREGWTCFKCGSPMERE